MNLITLATAAATFGDRPSESFAAWWILPATLAVIIVVNGAGYLTVEKHWHWLTTVVPALLIVGAIITGTTLLTIADMARADKEIAAWNTETAAWAKNVYGVEAGANDLRSGLVRECPMDTACYPGKVLIGDRIVGVTMVTIGDRTLMLEGDGESGKEMPRDAK